MSTQITSVFKEYLQTKRLFYALWKDANRGGFLTNNLFLDLFTKFEKFSMKIGARRTIEVDIKDNFYVHATIILTFKC